MQSIDRSAFDVFSPNRQCTCTLSHSNIILKVFKEDLESVGHSQSNKLLLFVMLRFVMAKVWFGILMSKTMFTHDKCLQKKYGIVIREVNVLPKRRTCV